ncbi:mitochondrial import inner membrane translocase subunit TIM44 [Brachionus plicatilis]|uniref:Mitochondrial import inner membrane translocase subunit TIM44 n=1 Tax=Brachionus plicatilis TaxID=10195 RepID=A0A3M7QQC5_BRAPC|nr:mitochondrial import inner membrane translocase subunit TIM44 [Brachionus plicatilis]
MAKITSIKSAIILKQSLVLLNPTCLLKQGLVTQNTRYMSNGQRSFLGSLIDNIKEEMNKNKEMKDSIKKFRQEAEKLEQSTALQEARKKYKELGDETDKSSQVFKEAFGKFAGSVKESDFAKKATEFGGDFAKQAQKAAENLSKQTAEFSKNTAFKAVSENVKTITDNFDEATQLSRARPYRAPIKLRKRTEIAETHDQKVYESNDDATGMVLHKDSKWYQSWQNFKENNTYVNKLFEIKTQYDESDNPLVRATRSVTEKFTSVFGGIFKSTEMSEVLTEIVKSEPNFELSEFLNRVQHEIVPNILEALSQKELEILQDWCTETAYTILTHPIAQCEQLKFSYYNQVLDINNLDIAACKMMEQGPVLIVSFTAQQIIYVTNSEGKVVEGDKDRIKRVHHVWALCRDPSDLNPNSAWRLMECAAHQSEMFV